jgi:hypothetical protein
LFLACVYFSTLFLFLSASSLSACWPAIPGAISLVLFSQFFFLSQELALLLCLLLF